MSANIFGTRFLGNRQPAWHELGTVVQEDISVSDAFSKAGMNYTVQKSQLVANVETEMNNVFVTVPTEKFAILRNPTDDDPNHRFFGMCSKDYEMIQNEEIAKMLDPLSEEWKTETVGALDNGKTIFVTLDAGSAIIKSAGKKKVEDPVSKYFLITETKDGGSAMKFAFTPVRVVCQNTLVSGLRAATVSSQITHRTGMTNELNWRLRLLADLSKAENTVMTNMQRMAEVILDNSQIAEVINSAYPLPKRSAKVELLHDFENPEEELSGYTDLLNELTEAQEEFEYWVNRVDIFRNNAMNLFNKFNDEQPAFANTGWAVYNAVVEVEDYRKGMKTVSESALWGARASTKKRAFGKVMQLMQ